MGEETKQLVKEITDILMEKSTSTEILALDLAIYVLEREKKAITNLLEK